MVRIPDIPALAVRRVVTFRRLARVLSSQVSEVKRAFNEFLALNLLPTVVHRVRNTDYFKAGMLYSICRITQPDFVIETGVAAGTSSTGILAALELNHKGQLFSIDFPNATYHKDDGSEWTDLIGSKPAGWLIPSRLRPMWTLMTGRSQELLPDLVGHVRSVSLFYHDSEHTEANMTFELETVWPVLSNRAVIVVDNANWSPAFPNFCRRHQLLPTFAFPYVGLASNFLP
jgi:hypothetical protein